MNARFLGQLALTPAKESSRRSEDSDAWKHFPCSNTEANSPRISLKEMYYRFYDIFYRYNAIGYALDKQDGRANQVAEPIRHSAMRWQTWIDAEE